ncbi:MAG TPA: hypothetical protein VGH93_06200 [Solirubrobacteraceae bacterium]
MFSVPFDLIAAGTSRAIAALTVGVGVAGVVDELEFELLLLPHPASASTASAGAPRRVTSLLIGNLLRVMGYRPRWVEAGQVYGRR